MRRPFLPVLMFVIFAVHGPVKSQPQPEATPGNEPAATEATEATPEEGTEAPAPEAKPHRRPYTETQFDMENMSDIEIENYQRIVKIREDSITKMTQLVENTPNYPDIASIYYRIAEYMTENIRFRIALQAKQYRKDIEKFRAGELTEEPEPPAKDYSATLPYYKTILIEHTEYPRVEEVLFYLGRNGLDTGRSLGQDELVVESIHYFDKLEQLFPQSKFLPNAFLMAGEYYFDKNNLFEALKYYKKLVEGFKDSPMYLYGLYKLGWVYYNYQQLDKAVVAFEEVIKGLREKGEETATLREMTFKDYIITVSEAGQGWNTASDFLKAEFGEEKAMVALHDLAARMAENGFYEDAISLFNHFVGLDPNGPRVLEYWNQILDIYRTNYPFDETEKQIRAARLFFRDDGAWYATHKEDSERVAAVEDFLVKWDLALAEHYLAEGLYFGKGDEAFMMAINRFRDILKQGAAGRVEQGYAGILMAYVGLIRSNSGGKLIFVAENVLGPTYPDDYKLPRKLNEGKLNEFELGFMEAKAAYLALGERKGQKPDLKPLAKVDMESDVLYTSALVYYVNGMPEKGLEDIDALLAHEPKGMYAGHCAEMTYQMSARTGQWSQLQARMKKLLDAQRFDIVTREQLLEWYCDAMIQDALVISSKGQAGDAMERLSSAAQACTELPDKAGEALYQLGQVAEKGGFFEQARTAYKRVMDEFGHSKYKNMAARRFQAIKSK